MVNSCGIVRNSGRHRVSDASHSSWMIQRYHVNAKRRTRRKQIWTKWNIPGPLIFMARQITDGWRRAVWLANGARSKHYVFLNFTCTAYGNWAEEAIAITSIAFEVERATKVICKRDTHTHAKCTHMVREQISKWAPEKRYRSFSHQNSDVWLVETKFEVFEIRAWRVLWDERVLGAVSALIVCFLVGCEWSATWRAILKPRKFAWHFGKRCIQ